MVGNEREEYSLLEAPSDPEDGTPRVHLPVPTRRQLSERTSLKLTVCYCCIMVLNGGLVGAFGPSLEPFSRQTGASLGVLGGAVMQNRLSKLAGTVLWGWYASRVQAARLEETLVVLPHALITFSLLCLAACCALFGFTRSAGVLQLTMNISGFMYGVSDSAANLLITWVWHHDARKQRIYVAVLNAMFTVGAFMTPMLIAASMHNMRGAIWPAYYCLAAGAILEALALPMLPSPPAPAVGAAVGGGGKGAAVVPADEALQPAADDADADDAADEKASLVSARDSRGVLSPAVPATGSKSKGRAVPGVAVTHGGGGTVAAAALADSSGGEAGSPVAAACWKAAEAAARAQAGWVYLGDPACEEVLPRYVVCMMAICTLCFFANGCEHAVATWLSSFGIQQRSLGEETMAIMTSNFWTAMSLGRIAWACFSGFVTSAWPALFLNTICCVLSAGAMAIPSHALLWSSAMGIGLGVASSYPAAVTVPAEMGITMSPRMMTTLQLSASFGEMLCPLLMGIAFQYRRYSLFYVFMFCWQSLVLCLLGLPWMLLTRRLKLPLAILRRLKPRLRAPA